VRSALVSTFGCYDPRKCSRAFGTYSAAVGVAGTVVPSRHPAAVLRDDHAGVPAPAWGRGEAA
jgi:hypothetical protein